MAQPSIPTGWTVRGHLPEIDAATARAEDLELLDEDILQISDPTGTYVLDIGWYPAASRDGHFVCHAALSDAWDEPIEEIETKNRVDVMQWLARWIEEVKDRIGTEGSLSDEALLTVQLDVVLHLPFEQAIGAFSTPMKGRPDAVAAERLTRISSPAPTGRMVRSLRKKMADAA